MANLDQCMGPLWKPKLWDTLNKEEYLKFSNCYSYAFNYIDYGEKKIQPGDIHGTRYLETTCNEIIEKIKNDYKNDKIKDITLNEKLSKDRYKIALFIDPDSVDKDTDDFDQDYHFYRQDCDGTWSHKPGTNNITNEDTNGNVITNPEKATHNFIEKCQRNNGENCNEEHNYTLFCGYLSVPLNNKDGPIIRVIERNNVEDSEKENNVNNENNK